MPYLAMTAAEFRRCTEIPGKPAWMACHFSPYGTGLSNLPDRLPENSLLILNDRTSVRGHDPQRIYDQLLHTVTELKCSAVLLDLQIPENPGTEAIVKKLLTLPCPVIVSPDYGAPLDCPIFLPPVPLRKDIDEHIAPWAGRDIWLDIATDGQQLTVTAEGAVCSPLPSGRVQDCPFLDGELLCHYGIAVGSDRAVFTLQRTRADAQKLILEAQKRNIHTVGLWQELHGI